MPDFEPVSGDPFATQLVPITGNPFDVASMTHQAEQPNPAEPYINAVKSFLQPPDLTPAHLPGTQPKDYLRELAQNPDILARTIDQASNFNFTGTTVPKEIIAYHGSPHDFDKFDISKIGTGEGAQTYGHGLYFAENEGVARDYRKNLTPQAYMVKEDDGTYSVENFSNARNPTFADLKRLRGFKTEEEARKVVAERNANLGRIYQVSIKADPEHFLDWDKPLSEQSEHVRKALANVAAERVDPFEEFFIPSAKESEGTVPHLMKRVGENDLDASAKLRSAGIPGIKYLDQFSRFGNIPSPVKDAAARIIDFYGGDPKVATEQFGRRISGLRSARSNEDLPLRGDRPADPKEVHDLLKSGWNPKQDETRNYVVFDDKLIDIMKKYGIAGLAALPAMGAHHFKMQPVDHDPFAEQ